MIRVFLKFGYYDNDMTRPVGYDKTTRDMKKVFV